MQLRAASLFSLSLLALFSAPAHASRVVAFSASGQNYYGGNARSITTSNCLVTITNNSNTPQVVTFVIDLVASGTTSSNMTSPAYKFTHTVTLAAASAGSSVGANCTSASNTCTFPDTATLGDVVNAASGSDPANADFKPIPATVGVAETQTVSCSGTIEVYDSVAGTPGFITAAGALTTYRESSAGAGLGAGGGSSRAITTTPSTTPIVIGEGRAF